jgi:NADP-dependent 3-hydroxy acid dehydrogenase YdfG
MGDSTFAVQLDITDAKNVDRLLDLIPDTFKPIDIFSSIMLGTISAAGRASTSDHQMTGQT